MTAYVKERQILVRPTVMESGGGGGGGMAEPNSPSSYVGHVMLIIYNTIVIVRFCSDDIRRNIELSLFILLYCTSEICL